GEAITYSNADPGGPTPSVLCVPIMVGLRYKEYPRAEGMNRDSMAANVDRSSTKALGSKVGSAMRAEDLLKRSIFLSGRKSLIFPFLSLYAFIPSKHSNA